MSSVGENVGSDGFVAAVNAAHNQLNGGEVTAGTVSASAAVVVSADKDIAGFRHIGLTGNLRRSVAVPAAAGSVQGDATALTADLNAVTAADGTKGVKLPTAVAGDEIIIINTVSNQVLKVYPATGGTINALSANAAFSVGPGQIAVFAASSTTQWYVTGQAAGTSTVTELNKLTGCTATAAELSKLAGATVTTGEINMLDDQVANITMAAAAGGTDICELTCTLKDAAGATIASPRPFTIWLSDAATGAGLTGVTASGTVTAKAASGEVMGTLTSKKALVVQPLATGVFILEITDSAKTGFYPVVQLPNGKIVVGTQLITGNYG